MSKQRLLIGLVLTIIAVAVMVAIGIKLAGGDIPVLQPKGVIAREQRELLITATLLMLIVVVPVFILTFAIAWRYRSSNKNATYKPDWDHDRRLETLWWGIPCIIIAVLAGMTWVTSHTLDPFKKIDSSKEPVRIQVVALQWKWLFIYPDESIATVNHLVIPTGRPVNFEITSDAPMNSFWIPSLAGQVYAMSGMSTKLHVLADTPGDYRGVSANISGEGFAGMDFVARAKSEVEYKAWLRSNENLANVLTKSEYEKLAKPSKNVKESVYVMGSTGLYDRIVMKYMSPDHKETHTETSLETIEAMSEGELHDDHDHSHE